MTLQVGLFIDGRNPPEWQQPWSEHDARLVDIAADADDLGADCIWLEHHGFELWLGPVRNALITS
jgi:hypothetical protein